jgi:hypothetical protein
MANLKKALSAAINKAKTIKKDPPDTPFQSYMKTRGATAADTSATNQSQARKLTENKPLLNKAYELTYGQDYKDNSQYTVRGVAKPLSTSRGDHSGYSNMNNPQRSAYEKEVAKAKKNK